MDSTCCTGLRMPESTSRLSGLRKKLSSACSTCARLTCISLHSWATALCSWAIRAASLTSPLPTDSPREQASIRTIDSSTWVENAGSGTRPELSACSASSRADATSMDMASLRRKGSFRSHCAKADSVVIKRTKAGRPSLRAAVASAPMRSSKFGSAAAVPSANWSQVSLARPSWPRKSASRGARGCSLIAASGGGNSVGSRYSAWSALISGVVAGARATTKRASRCRRSETCPLPASRRRICASIRPPRRRI